MARRKVRKLSKERSPDPTSDDDLSSEHSDVLERDSDDEAELGLRRSARKRKPPRQINTFTMRREPLAKARKAAQRLEVENAAKVVVQLFRDPFYLASNTKFSADTPLGMIPGLLRKNMSHSGRKRKLNPDERILLAELYQQNFTVYHSKRYFDPDYRIDIADYGNLKYWLLDDWAKKLSALGPSERSAVDIANRVHEMVMDVVDYRTQQKGKRDNTHDATRATAYEMSPCFFIFNKVYNFINQENAEIEKLLDRYEFTLCQMLEEKNLAHVLSRHRSPLSAEEAVIVCRLFSASASEYDKLLIMKSGLSEQEGLLAGWVLQLQQAGYKRLADEIRAFIHIKRKELTDMERTHRTMEMQEQFDMQNDVKRKARKSNETPQKRKRDLSPSQDAINRAIGPFTIAPITREDLFRRIRDIQNEMMAEKTSPFKKQEAEYRDESSERELTEDEEIAEIMERADKNEEDAEEAPQNDSDIGSASMDMSHLESVPSTSFSLRINRPHMIKAEKRLLAMLYRQSYKDYEKYNYCRTVKTNPGNRKWVLLNEWSHRLTSLGVAQREPQELATKIIQYKKNVSQHYEAKEKGIHNLRFANRWAKQKCTRPLTPTTKFFDVNDESINPTLYSDEAVDEFVEEAQETRRLYTNRMGQYLHTDSMDNGLFQNSRDNEERRNYSMVGNDYEHLEDEVDVKPPLATLQALLSPVEKKPGPLLGLSSQLHPEMTLRDALACVEAHTTNQIENTMEDEEDVKPAHVPENLQAVLEQTSPGGTSVRPQRIVENPTDIHEMVYEDLLTMGNECQVLLYDSVGTSGHIQRFAVTRTVKDRDTNYLLWSKNIVLELEMPVTQYVCQMCEQMAAAAYANAMGQRRTANGVTFLNSTQNSYLLSQQPLPSISVTADSRLVPMEWVKTGPPKHRCVPLLKPTICEKLVELSHMLIRVEVPYVI